MTVFLPRLWARDDELPAIISMHYQKSIICSILLILVCTSLVNAQRTEDIARKIGNPIVEAEEERKALRQAKPQQVTIVSQGSQKSAEFVDIQSDKQERVGDVVIATGRVKVIHGDILVIADQATYNKITGDLIAEGNVFFDQEGQQLTGERFEYNAKTKRGTIFKGTGFTKRTPEGVRLFVDADLVNKTGEDTYRFDHVRLTACPDDDPKWGFTASHARIRMNDKATIYNALFRIKNVPVFYLPYATISINEKDRQSGFLLPSSGSSSIKGRTFSTGYFQTLGRSADLLIRSDLYTKRGLGFGFDFRAKPSQNSHIMFGSFMVFDRLFGEKGPNQPDQGGSSFYVDAVQYFKNGFIAVADVNITSSFTFRQVFSDNILTAISPEERSIFYLNRNWDSYSLNILFGEQSSFIGQYNSQGLFVADNSVKVRKFPSVELSKRSSKISESLPVYFSFDSTLEGVRRTEMSGDVTNLKTPSIVQRLDLSPRLTFPLKEFAGFRLTPSLGLSSTFYSDSIDPVQRQVAGQNLLRTFADFELDIRPPALERVFHHGDDEPWFKHVIEPFIQYRRIAGIDDFDRTIRVDELDAIADTNEITYGISNSFFVRRPLNGKNTQPFELLNLTITQKYFFDPTFGGALREGERNQFYPINTLSGFAFGGIKRDFSPLNVRARVRPTSSTWADFRVNYDTEFQGIRDLIVGAGYMRHLFSFSHNWMYTRRISVDQDRFDPTTLPGNQMDFSAVLGNYTRGPYGGLILSYDLRNQTFSGAPRERSLIGMTTSAGYSFDCCSINVQNVTFNAGFRNENRIVFAFTLKGIGTIGTDTFGQLRRRP